jgi:hypothetical protein
MHQLFARRVTGDVALQRERLAAGCVDPLRIRLCLSAAARCQHHRRAGLGKRHRGSFTNASAGTRYNCNFSCQALHRASFHRDRRHYGTDARLDKRGYW